MKKLLSVHSIFKARREAFYWLTILFTFALGTAVGDYVAEELALGYTLTGLIVIIIIGCTFIAWKLFKFNSILTFWIAYVLTRPLGASFGDFMSQPQSLGGIGLGATVTSIIFLSAILVVVIFLYLTKIDQTPNEKSKVNENRTTSKKVILQASMMVCVFVVAGVFIGIYANNHNKAIENKNDLAGELAGFISTENDMRGYVVANDFTDATAKADTLEHDWDSEEGTLRPQNQGQWTAIDSTFDQVLTIVRTTTDTGKCKSSIDNSLAVLVQINNGSQIDTTAAPSAANLQGTAPQQSTANSTSSSTAGLSLLGDLSNFIKIETDTLNLVNKGDLASAKTRIKDLETAWDKAQSTLQPKDPAKWTQIDGTIDNVLSKLRANNPSQSGCKSALETSIAAMQK